MEENKTFTSDEGYFFGLGFFETIAVEKGQPLLLDWHLERLVDSCRLLGITFPCSAENVEKILSEKDCPEKGVLKIVASSENILFLTRERTTMARQTMRKASVWPIPKSGETRPRPLPTGNP